MMALLALLLLCATALSALDEAELRLRLQELERRGDLAHAADDYAALLKLQPDDVNIARGLARALSAAGQHERVVEHLRVWLRKHEGDVLSLLLLGDAQQQLGQSDEALKTWRQLLQMRPDDPLVYQQVSDRCQAAGLRDEAIKVLAEGHEVLGDDGLFSWELASLYLDAGRYERAVPLYLKSLVVSPNRLPVVEHHLGPMCQADSGALLKALLKADVSSSDPLPKARLVSTCALFAGQPERGLTALEALADRPEMADMLFQYAAQCEARGFTAVAALAYGSFAERRPDSPYAFRALLKRAEISAKGPKAALALAHYAELAQRFPGRPEAMQALVGIARLQLRDGADAEVVSAGLRPVLEASVRGSWTIDALGLMAESALRADRLEDAETHIEQLGKQGQVALYETALRRAELAYYRGDCAAVIASLAELTADDVDHPLANDALDLLLACEEYKSEALLPSLVKAQLLERQRQPEKARPHWRAVFAGASPRLREWALLQGGQWAESERPALALELYERLVREFPQGRHWVEAQLARAELHVRAAQVQEALRICEAALLAAPDDARAPELRLRIRRLRKTIASESG